jgi:signal transduction histidine kinase
MFLRSVANVGCLFAQTQTAPAGPSGTDWLQASSGLLLALGCLGGAGVLGYLLFCRRDFPQRQLLSLTAGFLLAVGAGLLLEPFAASGLVAILCGGLRLLAAGLAGACVFLLARALPDLLRTRLDEQLQRELVELKKTSKAVRDKFRQVLDAERSRTDFLASVTHELRTPLTLICGPIEALLGGEHGPLGAEQQHCLEIIHNNAVRLLQMVTGLLDLSKLDSSKVVINRQPTDIAGLTKSMLADFKPLMRQRGLECVFSGEPEGRWVSMDRYLYERIVFNLLSNAVKFTPEGGLITVELVLHGDRLRLSVQDTGIGIAADDLHQLFQRYRQVEGSDSSRAQGIGLGLALIKEFSELLGGKVSVESALGKGSKFTVECLAPPCAPRPAGRPLEELTGKTDLLQKYGYRAVPPVAVLDGSPRNEELPRVLIAEDNEELGAYIAALLQSICRTRLARDGDAALELVRSWAPELVLADVMMPRRDGLSLCKQIKASPETASIPVVLVTALVQREALLKGWEAGADEYLFKPFHPKELVTRVRSILAGAHERKHAAEKLRQSERLAAIGQMVAGLAHESRNALQQTQACLELLTLKLKDRPEVLQLVMDIQKAQDHLHHLYEEVRGYAAPIKLRREWSDLAALLGDTWARLGPMRKHRQAHLELEDDGLDLHCDVDQLAIGQVFRNVLENALCASPDPVRVHAHWAEVDLGGQAALQVSLRDNGPGLTAEAKQKIFEPFFTTKTQGTGLGMAIAKRIVEAHGGRIAVGSATGQGAEILITLPRKRK